MILLALGVLTAGLLLADRRGRLACSGAALMLIPSGVEILSQGGGRPLVTLGMLAAIPAAVTVVGPSVPSVRRLASALALVLAATLLVTPLEGRAWRGYPLLLLLVILMLVVALAAAGYRGDLASGLIVALMALLVMVTVLRTLAPVSTLSDGARRLPGDTIALAGALLGLDGRASSPGQFALAAIVGVVMLVVLARGVIRSTVIGRLAGGSVALGLLLHVMATRSRGGFDDAGVAAAAGDLLPVVMAAVAMVLATDRSERSVVRPGRTADEASVVPLVAVVGLLIAAHLNALQWQVVDLLLATTRFDVLIGVDRSLEVIAWSGVVAVAFCSRGSDLGRPPNLSRTSMVAAGTALVGASLVMLTIHGGVTLLADGLGAAPLRPIAIMGGIVVAARFGPRTLAGAFLLAAGVGLVSALIVGAAGWEGAYWSEGRSMIPGFAGLEAGRLSGLYPHPNTLGAFAALWVVIALSLRPGAGSLSSRLSVVGLAAVGLVALVATDSRTAMLALVAGIAGRAIAPALKHLVRPDARLGLSILGGLSFSALPFLLQARLDPGALNSRIHLWQQVLDTLEPSERLVGVGPEPLLRPSSFTDRLFVYWPAGDSHNITVEMLLVAGGIGVLAATMFSVTLLWAAIETSGRSGGWSIAIAVTALVLAFGETFFLYGPGDGRDVLLITVGLIFAWSRLPDEGSTFRARERVGDRSVA